MSRRRDVAGSRVANDVNPSRVPAPTGRWLVAGAPTTDTYPCACRGSKPCTRACPCRGRTDTDTMPTTCCQRRATETHHRTTTGEDKTGDDAIDF